MSRKYVSNEDVFYSLVKYINTQLCDLNISQAQLLHNTLLLGTNLPVFTSLKSHFTAILSRNMKSKTDQRSIAIKQFKKEEQEF